MNGQKTKTLKLQEKKVDIMEKEITRRLKEVQIMMDARLRMKTMIRKK